jgi:capsular polysaccharide biosynthesis protein/Mrp family chromosome partitioning ATPase
MSSGFVPVIRRWWWLLLVAAAVAGATAYLASARVPATYEAEARLLVGPINTDRDTLRASSELAQTYAALATSGPVVERAVERIGGTAAEDAAEPDVAATANDVTRILTIRARDDDAALAAALANAVADTVVTLPTQGLARPEGQLQVIERAEPPADPVDPDPLLIALLAALAGLLGALGLALLLDSLNRTVRSGEELSRFEPVPFLGTLDSLSRANGWLPLVVVAKPQSPAAAAYRLLAARIASAGGDDAPKRLLVAAAGEHDVAVSVSANLAAAFAGVRGDVVLVDASENGSVTRLLTRNGRDGASSRLVERIEAGVHAGAAVVEQFRLRDQPRLRVVRPDPSELAEAGRARALLDALLVESRLVVVHASPLGRSPSALTWARAADATLVAVGRESTRPEDVELALETLKLARARVIGTVLDGGAGL